MFRKASFCPSFLPPTPAEERVLGAAGVFPCPARCAVYRPEATVRAAASGRHRVKQASPAPRENAGEWLRIAEATQPTSCATICHPRHGRRRRSPPFRVGGELDAATQIPMGKSQDKECLRCSTSRPPKLTKTLLRFACLISHPSETRKPCQAWIPRRHLSDLCNNPASDAVTTSALSPRRSAIAAFDTNERSPERTHTNSLQSRQSDTCTSCSRAMLPQRAAAVANQYARFLFVGDAAVTTDILKDCSRSVLE